MPSGAPIWIDIENPPQVQVMVPFISAFQERGRRVVVTARDAGITFELLRGRGVAFAPVGVTPPSARLRKLSAVADRGGRLYGLHRRDPPAAVICSSRPAAIAARLAGIPCFVICDYEHAELGIFRRTGATVMHPSVIPAAHFTARGFGQDRLVSFAGIKEDISFAGIDLDAVAPFDFGPDVGEGLRILVRPPAEISHYFNPRSKAMMIELLRHLGDRDDVLTIFSPRYPDQVNDLDRVSWRRPPVVLREAVPFLSLLKAVDRVVSAGGTMIREAAYLGVPAYSAFGGELGAVDAYLARTGRVKLLHAESDLPEVSAPVPALEPFPRNPAVLDQLADAVLSRAGRGRRTRWRSSMPVI